MNFRLIHILYVFLFWLCTSLDVNANVALVEKNAFAYDVTVEVDEDYSVVVNYRLNGIADKVMVQAWNGLTLIDEAEGTRFAGINGVKLDISESPAGTVSFKVVVTSANGDITEPTLIVDENTVDGYWRFFAPYGLAINKNTDSGNFGQILITESIDGDCSTQTDIQPSSETGGGIGIGVYAFTPQMQPIKNANGKYGFQFGLTPDEANYITHTAYNVNDFKRLKFSEDGRLFLGRNGVGNYSPIYELNPEDLNAAASPIFPNMSKYAVDKEPSTGGTDFQEYASQTANGTFVAGSCVGFDVYGSGENLKMAIVSNYYGIDGMYQTSYSVDVYNLGTSTYWDKAPTKNVAPLADNRMWMFGQHMDCHFSNNGAGLLVVNQRNDPSENQISYAYVSDYATATSADKDYSQNSGGSAFAWNKDKTMFAMCCGANNVAVYKAADFAGANTISKTPLYKWGHTTGSRATSIAWDYADNLYICSNGGEKIISFAIPRLDGDLTETTPAPSKYNVTIVDPEIILTAEKRVDEVQVGRQDAVLTWNAIDDAVSYNVYCDGALIANTTELTYTQTDLSRLKTYTYTVTPVFETQQIAITSNEATVATEIITVAPVLSTPIDHSGYATAELLWKQPYGIIPDYYNVYRDNVLVSTVKAFDYVEANLTEGNHEWKVEGVYSNGASAESNPAGVYVSARQLDKVSYIVEEVYDYDMTEVTSKPSDFTSADKYRQGAYYNGNWYIMGTSGNILKFSTDDPRTGYTVAHNIGENQSVGIAVDESGNILVRGMNSLDTEKAIATNYMTQLENAVIYSNDFATSKNVALYNMNDVPGYEDDYGRADYYSVSGNVLTGTGYLYYIYNNDNRVIKETIVNGVSTDCDILTLDAYSAEGTENYVFPISGADNYMAILRNRIIVDGNKNVVSSSLSRASRAGGATVNFDGKNIVVLPDEIGESTVGNFVVSFMNETSSDYSSLVPVFYKNYASSSVVNTMSETDDVAGNWVAAEVGTWDAGECVYIYQYVPGVRFAKYRLYPSDAFPATNVGMTISTMYNDDNTEILSLDGEITWSAPELAEGFNYDVTYSLQLKDGNGDVVKNKSGEDVTTVNAVEGQTLYSVTDYDNLDYGVDYTAYLTVNYATDADSRSSETTTGSASKTYPVYATESPVVTIMYNLNYDKLDPNSWIMQYVNTKIDFDAPNYNDAEPVSHYEVYYTADNGQSFTKLENFVLNDGASTVVSEVPGNFDFDATDYVLTWEEFTYKGLDENGNVAYTADVKSHNYNYIVRAVYAANATNQNIRKSADSGLAVLDRIETGIENVEGTNVDMKVYPIPAQSVINVNISEGIEVVEFYTLSGALIKKVDGNGETEMVIDIEELTSGYYFLKVNNLPMKKIVKK